MAQIKKNTMFVKFVKSFVYNGKDVSPKDTEKAPLELPINSARLFVANGQAVEIEPKPITKKDEGK